MLAEDLGSWTSTEATPGHAFRPSDLKNKTTGTSSEAALEQMPGRDFVEGRNKAEEGEQDWFFPKQGEQKWDQVGLIHLDPGSVLPCP